MPGVFRPADLVCDTGIPVDRRADHVLDSIPGFQNFVDTVELAPESENMAPGD